MTISRIALGLSYNGRDFSGWQSQPGGNTVQDRLEQALSGIADAPVRVAAAGRTDAGVHALSQVVHFDTEAQREEQAWVRGSNANLPGSIAVQWARRVPADFHARFSAQSRSYRYVLHDHPIRPSIHDGLVGWFHQPLDVPAMQFAAQALMGEHDFSAFRAAECQARTPVRVLESLTVQRHAGHVVFGLTANAFLHHMVRNIVGCLVYVGCGRQPPQWLAEVLASRQRRVAAPTFSASGLYLSAVRYDPQLQLPAGCALTLPALPVLPEMAEHPDSISPQDPR
jgi:tRNA pseudouridine38-40 synthase